MSGAVAGALPVRPADAGAPAGAPTPEPPVPWLLVGRRVRRAFPPAPGAIPRLFDGVVIGVRSHPVDGTLWRVHYEEDGDREELSWAQLNAALVGEAAPPGFGAPAVSAPAAVVTPTPSAGRDEQLDASAAGAAEVSSLQRAGLDETRGGEANAGAGCDPPRVQQPTAKYKGVWLPGPKKPYYRAGVKDGSNTLELGPFTTALEAARAYDAAIRQRGRLVVNFPHPGSAEVQAVYGESESATSSRHTPSLTKADAPQAGAQPMHAYKGVRTNGRRFTAKISLEQSMKFSLGSFATAHEAACAYDAEVRRRGRLVVNFPRPGTAELQAVRMEKEQHTLRRHGRIVMPAEASRAKARLSHAPQPGDFFSAPRVVASQHKRPAVALTAGDSCPSRTSYVSNCRYRRAGTIVPPRAQPRYDALIPLLTQEAL